MQSRSLRSPAVLIACMLVSIASVAHAAAPRLMDARRMLIVDGQPRLILGLYETPKDDGVLREAVDAGFNLFQSAPDAAALDRIQSVGAKAWVNLGGALDLSENADKRHQQLQAAVQKCASHPALLVWEGPDEILWNHWWVPMEVLKKEQDLMRRTAEGHPDHEALARRARDRFDRGLFAEFERARAEFWAAKGTPSPNPKIRVDDAPMRLRRGGAGISAGLNAVRSMDPRHVLWMNHAPRNSIADLRLYNAAADMAGCDIYPVPANLQVGHSDLTDMTLGSVGAYTRRMSAGAPGKACAMVLQGFGWRDLRERPNEAQNAVGIGRRPTFAESRFMAYDALLHGANAVLYWGTAYMKPVEDDGSAVMGRPRLWRDLLRVARELRALEPAWLAAPEKGPRATLAPTYGSMDGQGVECTLRRVGSEDVLIVANRTREGLAFQIEKLPSRLNGRLLHRLCADETVRPVAGRFADGIRAWDVHVYATSRQFEAPQARPLTPGR